MPSRELGETTSQSVSVVVVIYTFQSAGTEIWLGWWSPGLTPSHLFQPCPAGRQSSDELKPVEREEVKGENLTKTNPNRAPDEIAERFATGFRRDCMLAETCRQVGRPGNTPAGRQARTAGRHDRRASRIFAAPPPAWHASSVRKRHRHHLYDRDDLLSKHFCMLASAPLGCAPDPPLHDYADGITFIDQFRKKNLGTG